MNRKLKDALPPVLLKFLRHTLHRLRLITLRLVASFDFTCAIYYCFFSRAFRREQRAVVEGLVRHLGSEDYEANLFLLKRNIHRLEKGLLMRPQQDVFAADYIEETVRCYFRCRARASSKECSDHLEWSKDVLAKYFLSVGRHPFICEAKALFENGEHDEQAKLTKLPYRRAVEPVRISFEDLRELAVRRRSVRWFRQERVPRDLIDRALEVATQAPSACNRQPFFYRFFDDPAKVERIAEIPMGTAGFSHNIPCIAVVIGDLSAYFGERDRHGIYIDASLSAMAFMLALETVGLSSCPLNWPDIERLERRLAKLLQFKPWERVIMLIALGYADPEGMVAYSEKNVGRSLCSFNSPLSEE